MAKKPDTPAAEREAQIDTEAAATPAVTILCRQPGFRRAGITHLAEATYAAGELTAEQLEAIKADPMFAVTEGGRLAPAAAGAEA